MIKNKTLRAFFGICLLLSIIAGLFVTVRRHNFEKDNRKVELILSYNEIEKLSLLSGINMDFLLVRLKQEAHITSITVEEDTLSDFVKQGIATVFKGSEIINYYRAGFMNPFILNSINRSNDLNPNHFYIMINEHAYYDRVFIFLEQELGNENVKRIENRNVMEVRAEQENLFSLGLGVSPEKISKINEKGFKIIPRLKNTNRLQNYLLRQKFTSIVNQEAIHTIIFEGDSVVGYPSKITTIRNILNDEHLNFGWIEFANQKGALQLARGLPQRVLRVHSIPETDLLTLLPKRAAQRYVRAAYERNVKLLFLHPFLNVQYDKNVLEVNIEFFDTIVSKLHHYKFEITPIKDMSLSSTSSARLWETFFLSLGALSLFFILIRYFITVSGLTLFFSYAVIAGLFLAASFLDLIPFWNRVFALLTAITCPTLAIISQFPKNSLHPLFRLPFGLFYIFKLVAICSLGALFIVGFLSHEYYFLGIYQYFGVKLSFIIPLVAIGLFFFLKPHRIPSFFHVFLRLFFAPVRTGVLVAVAVCVVFVVIYILRSGNYMIGAVPFYELSIRETLESIFFVRPRIKEYLIGYPFLLFTFITIDRGISRNWLWFFNTLGSVALISMINSFCHIHTPLVISVYRSFLGVVLGCVIGFIIVSAYFFISALLKKIFQD